MSRHGALQHSDALPRFLHNSDMLPIVSSFYSTNGLDVLRLAKVCREWFEALSRNSETRRLAGRFLLWKKHSVTMRWRGYGGTVVYDTQIYGLSLQTLRVPREYRWYLEERYQGRQIYFQGIPDVPSCTRPPKEYSVLDTNKTGSMCRFLPAGDNELSCYVVPQGDIGIINADVLDFGCWILHHFDHSAECYYENVSCWPNEDTKEGDECPLTLRDIFGKVAINLKPDDLGLHGDIGDKPEGYLILWDSPCYSQGYFVILIQVPGVFVMLNYFDCT